MDSAKSLRPVDGTHVYVVVIILVSQAACLRNTEGIYVQVRTDFNFGQERISHRERILDRRGNACSFRDGDGRGGEGLKPHLHESTSSSSW